MLLSLSCYPLSIVVVDSYHPSTLQADAHSGGGGACRCRCCAICHPLLLSIATAHPPCKQTLAAVVVVLVVIVVVICPLSLSIATTHPPCKQTLAAVVVVLVAVVVTRCRHSTHKQLLEELDAGGVVLYCQKIMLQRLRHREALTLRVSHFTGLLTPLYRP